MSRVGNPLRDVSDQTAVSTMSTRGLVLFGGYHVDAIVRPAIVRTREMVGSPFLKQDFRQGGLNLPLPSRKTHGWISPVDFPESIV